jgi:CBS-domain-containing membrane protein
VACAQWLPGGGIAAAASVGLAIGVMYYARCIHPPGGATALAAVIGGPNIHALGYEYILTPIAINTVTILLVALLFNALFRWRRYPAFLIAKESGLDSAHQAYAPVDHANFVYALSQMDTFIDVTEDDLLKIYQLATGREVNSNSE